MAINEQHRQLEIARDLEEAARSLAHSTRTVPNPSESYDLIAELRSTIASLGQVSRQLARWTTNTTDGIHHQGHDPSTDTSNPVNESAKALKAAATALDATYTHLDHAQGQNGRIRWNSVEEMAVAPAVVQEEVVLNRRLTVGAADEMTRPIDCTVPSRRKTFNGPSPSQLSSGGPAPSAHDSRGSEPGM